MKKPIRFIRTSLIGGLLVIAPIALLAFILTWLFSKVRALVKPISSMMPFESALASDLLAVFFILMACFAVGFLVRTKFGSWFHGYLEKNFLKKAPGYNLIKETVSQFIGDKKSPFSSVALVQIFANETMVSAFVTDEHEDGSYTVFVPTGPNPTSGNIFHLKGKYVHKLDTSVEDAMRSIISCGAGSNVLVKNYLAKK